MVASPGANAILCLHHFSVHPVLAGCAALHSSVEAATPTSAHVPGGDDRGKPSLRTGLPCAINKRHHERGGRMTVSLTVLLMRTSGLVMRVDRLQYVTKETAKPITPITGHA